MRKSLLLLGMIVGLLVPGAPAHAQPADLRDPFRPLLSTDVNGTTGDDPAPADPTVEDPTIADDPDPLSADDGLPNTGSDATPWLAGAYALISVGAGLVAVARVARPDRRRLGA